MLVWLNVVGVCLTLVLVNFSIKLPIALFSFQPSQVGQLDRHLEAVLPEVTLADFKVLGLIDNVSVLLP